MPTRELLELVDELDRSAERDEMTARDLLHVNAEPLPHDPPLEREREEAVVAALHEPVGTSGQDSSGHGSSNGVADCGGSSAIAAAFTSAGTSWKNASSMSTSPTSSSHPVAVHHSWKVSPGRGTIALTRISSSTGTRSQTSGAVKPPIDCATSTIGRRSPIASTTASVYSASPALVGSRQVHGDRAPAAPLQLVDDAMPVPRGPAGPGTSTNVASMHV